MSVLLSSGSETEQVVAKLADFGLSTVVNEGRDPSTYAGTKKYLAPVSCLYFALSNRLICATLGNRIA